MLVYYITAWCHDPEDHDIKVTIQSQSLLLVLFLYLHTPDKPILYEC